MKELRKDYLFELQNLGQKIACGISNPSYMTSHRVQNLQTSTPIQSNKELVLYKLVPTSYQKISQRFTTLIVFWCNLAILCKHENTSQDMSIITSRSKNHNTGKIVIHVLPPAKHRTAKQKQSVFC
jgi:hypothetical protein